MTDRELLELAAEREECARVAAWILKMTQNDVSSAIRARGMYDSNRTNSTIA